MEKTICAEPALSKADEELTKIYEAALKPLSSQGQAAIRDAQRAWLGVARKVCHLDSAKSTADGKRQPASECLKRLYEDRRKLLNAASPQAGPFQFYQVVIYAPPQPVEEGWEGNNDFTLCQIAYLQIDKPATDDQKAWNEAMTRKLSSEDDCPEGDHSEQPGVVGAGLDFISVATDEWNYGGGPHGTGGTVPSTRLLKERRNIGADDLFKPGSGWEKKLSEQMAMAIANYSSSDEDQNGEATADTVQGVKAETADRVKRGDISVGTKGLGFYQGAYEFGEYIDGYPYLDGLPEVVFVSWQDLKSYLNPVGPVSLTHSK